MANVSFIKDNGYVLRGKHHESYLGDPRRTALEKLSTVLRQPVKGEKENEYPLEIVGRCLGCMAEQL